MKKTLTMSIGNPENIVSLVRQAYWFEGKNKWAEDTLDCFEGIKEKHKEAILNGNATLKLSDDGKRVNFVEEIDEDFKHKKDEHAKYLLSQYRTEYKKLHQAEMQRRKAQSGLVPDTDRAELIFFHVLKQRKRIKELENNIHLFGLRTPSPITVLIGRRQVPSYLLDEYTNKTVKRLRLFIKNPTAMRDESLDFEGLNRIQKLEDMRKLLHDLILKEVGLNRKDKEYYEFSKALEEYIKKQGAGM